MRIQPGTRTAFLTGVLLATATGCSAPVEEVEPPLDTLVSTQWLSENLGDPDLVVLDCTVLTEMDESGGYTSVSGRSAYDQGHIPSAGFADLTAGLSDADSQLQYGLPTPEEFAAAMGALGVGNDSRVVLYDRGESAWAARVWWMLRWIGFDRAALLDGGLEAWTAEGRPLSTDPPSRTPAILAVKPRPELIADRDEVRAAIEDDGVVLIDVLPEAHYRGEMAFYARPGHIASAINIPMSGFTDESGHFRSLEETAALHGEDRDGRYITYCGGGIAASLSAFVMTRLGYTDVAVYTASLEEWAADPANPMEVGAR